MTVVIELNNYHPGANPVIYIQPNPYLRERDPLTGWRAWARRWLRIPFAQGRVVVAMPGNVWVTHPNNVQSVAEACRRGKVAFEIIPSNAGANLRAVPDTWGLSQ